MEALSKLAAFQSLTNEEAALTMEEIMSGEATDAQIASFMTALRMKGETVEELLAFANVMRRYCRGVEHSVQPPLLDIVGTGGDRIKTFNVSTAAALVVSGCGVPVAKHGNRSFTSKSGSADVLEKLGVCIEVEPETVRVCIETGGIGFMFAPRFHPAMKFAAVARRETGLRSVFNLLGPITNPAKPSHILLGVYDARLVESICNVLKALGLQSAMVVHGVDGVDEVSTLGGTKVAQLRDGEVSVFQMTPQDFGIVPARPKDVAGYSPEANAELIFSLLFDGRVESRAKDMVVVNAASALMVAEKASGKDEAVDLVYESLKNGRAYSKLKSLVKLSGGDPAVLESMEKKYENNPGYHS